MKKSNRKNIPEFKGIEKTECGSPAIYHKDCPKGGQGGVMVGGWGHKDMPMGFGFAPGDSRFRVDVARYKFYNGGCMDCGAEGDFIIVNRKAKHIVKHPRSINNKIQKARG